MYLDGIFGRVCTFVPQDGIRFFTIFIVMELGGVVVSFILLLMNFGFSFGLSNWLVIEKGLTIGEGALTVSSFWHRDNSQIIITTLILNQIKIGSS